MAETTPYDVVYPVDFYSGGDTTKEAFGKLIQETKRIYGVINSINADKMSASEFTEKLSQHANSENPHPNLKLSSLGGKLDVSQIEGDIPASRISGVLGRATIAAGNVTGLGTAILDALNSNLPKVGTFFREGGVGYVDFNMGLQIRFGDISVKNYDDDTLNETTIRKHSFAKPFSTSCLVMAITLKYKNPTVHQHENLTAFIHTHEREEFSYHIEINEGGEVTFNNLGIHYIAIGY